MGLEFLNTDFSFCPDAMGSRVSFIIVFQFPSPGKNILHRIVAGDI